LCAGEAAGRDGYIFGGTGGAFLTNRKDYHWTYNGIELGLTKRLSDRWMGRLAFTWNDWKEHVGPGATEQSNPTSYDQDPKLDGKTIAYYFPGTSGKIYYVSARWQLSANLLYQLPADFEIAASIFGRDGYANPIYARLDSGVLDGNKNVLAEGTEMTTERFSSLWDVDLRLAKNLRFGQSNLVLSAEVFNLFNSNTEMKRVNQFNASTYGRLDEILAPRIVRFGARVTF